MLLLLLLPPPTSSRSCVWTAGACWAGSTTTPLGLTRRFELVPRALLDDDVVLAWA